jgi:hypothetical protein
VIEGIVTLDRVPKYCGVQRIVGSLINSRFRSPGGVSVAPPTLALSANYIGVQRGNARRERRAGAVLVQLQRPIPIDLGALMVFF